MKEIVKTAITEVHCVKCNKFLGNTGYERENEFICVACAVENQELLSENVKVGEKCINCSWVKFDNQFPKRVEGKEYKFICKTCLGRLKSIK